MNKLCNILFWNCSNGLLSKIFVVKEIITDLNPYLFFISEAELKNEEQIKACSIENYTLHVSKGMALGKSRSCCFLRDGLDFTRLNELESLELILFESKSHRLRIGGFYKPFTPPENMSAKQMESDLLSGISKAAITELDFFCGGDMNIDMLKMDNKALEHASWLVDNGLNQLVKDFTRYRVAHLANGQIRYESSMIDHVYSNKEAQDIGLIPTAFSDHEILCLKRPLEEVMHRRKKIKIRNWNQYSEEKLLDYLSTKEMNIHNYSSLMIEAFNDLVPLRTCRIKPGQVVCPNLEKMKKKRCRILKQYRKTGKDYHLDEARKLGRILKKEYKKRIKENIQMKANANDPKAFWATVNEFLGRKTNKELAIKRNDIITTNPKELAKIFLDFFIGKVNDLARLDKCPIMDVSSGHPGFQPLQFTHEDLAKALKGVKNKKCSGIDNIPLIVAKDFVHSHMELSLQIFNDAARCFPDEWRTAKVLPLLKKGNNLDVNNYRPISNLVSMSKIYERLLLQRLLDETDGMEGRSQHGFRKSYSTATAVLELQSIIAKALDEGSIVAVYSVDLSAAFDLLRIDTFDKIISSYISSGLRHSLIEFLKERKITVDIDGHRSNIGKLEVGCVQGSTLGPRLFTLYTSQISSQLNADGFVCYADDSYVVTVGKTIEEVTRRVSSTSKIHVEYLESLGMKVNTSKTEIVFFSKKEEIVCEVPFADTLVKTQPFMKVLGVVFDYRLTWEKHVRQVVAKSSAKLSVLQKLRRFYTRKQFIQILTSQFFSTLYYCSQAWLTSTTHVKLWKIVNSIHYRALRVALHEYRPKTNREKIDLLCGRASPKQWSKYCIASLVINCLQNGKPTLLVSFIRETLYHERRSPNIGKFYNNAKGKIGRQKLGNNLEFMSAIRDDWLDTGTAIGPDRLRRILKKTFFAYLNQPTIIDV